MHCLVPRGHLERVQLYDLLRDDEGGLAGELLCDILQTPNVGSSHGVTVPSLNTHSEIWPYKSARFAVKNEYVAMHGCRCLQNDFRSQAFEPPFALLAEDRRVGCPLAGRQWPPRCCACSVVCVHHGQRSPIAKRITNETCSRSAAARAKMMVAMKLMSSGVAPQR